MKKFVLGVLLATFSLAASLLQPRYALAQIQLGLFGQDHNYSVIFRGNGEAIVSARIVFTNEDGEPLSSVNLRVPRVDPRDTVAFQVFREGICSRFQPAELKVAYTPPICLDYQEPDHFQSWYGSDKYQKTKVVTSADTITIALPQPVKPGASGSIILSFRAFGYAKKSLFDSYDFTFETLKTDDPIRTLRVGITTDSDIFIRGGKGKVDYRFEDSLMALKTTDASAPSANPQLDSFVRQIGQGEIYKTANNLLPLDSYLVKGSFADSKIKLYAKEISVSIVLSLVFFFLLRRAAKKVFSTMKSGFPWARGSRPISIDLFLIFGSSFVSAFLIVAYTLILVFGRGLFFSILPYEFGDFFPIMIILISIGIYGLLLSIPALVMGFRRNIFWGLSAFGMTIFWLLVGGVVIFMVLLLANRRTYPPYPVTFTESVSKPVGLDSVQSTPQPGK